MAEKGEKRDPVTHRTPTQKRRDNKKYMSDPANREDNKARKRARRKMVAAGKARKGDGRDVDHKDGNPRNNSVKNLRLSAVGKNRRTSK